MSVKAIEDALAVAKVVAVQIIQARTAGKPFSDVLKSPELEAAVALAVPELPEVPAEALDLSLLEDAELAEYVFGAAMEIVKAVKTAKAG